MNDEWLKAYMYLVFIFMYINSTLDFSTVVLERSRLVGRLLVLTL